jgi:hypothetical protein
VCDNIGLDYGQTENLRKSFHLRQFSGPLFRPNRNGNLWRRAHAADSRSALAPQCRIRAAEKVLRRSNVPRIVEQFFGGEINIANIPPG